MTLLLIFAAMIVLIPLWMALVAYRFAPKSTRSCASLRSKKRTLSRVRIGQRKAT
jgi:hypothetical protein